MKKFALLITALLSSSFLFPGDLTTVQEQSYYKDNILKNSGFENGIANWTRLNSNFSIITAITDPTNIGQGFASGKINPVSYGSVQSIQYTIPNYLKNEQCMVYLKYKGGSGQGTENWNVSGSNMRLAGGMGGSSFFGGNGGSGPYAQSGLNGGANTGGGGGSKSALADYAGSGGGGGGYVEAIIPSPSSTYTYTVGGGGSGGSGGSGAGSGGSASTLYLGSGAGTMLQNSISWNIEYISN